MSGYAGQHRERADRLAQLKAGRRRGAAGSSLSAVIAQQPSTFNGSKIAAVDKGITALDELPDRYNSIKVRAVACLCRGFVAIVSPASPPPALRALQTLPAHAPSRSASKTLYVSKNGLRSLEGVAQFRELRALSAADNNLTDLDVLRAIPAAGIALEAASFVSKRLGVLSKASL